MPTRHTNVFDLASAERLQYDELKNDKSVRIERESDFFAVVGGGPDGPGAPVLMRAVDYVEQTPEPVGSYAAPIC